MVLVEESFTAAQAALGTNLADGKYWEESPFPRRITRIGLIGSTAEADCKVSVHYGDKKVGEKILSSEGANIGIKYQDDVAVMNTQQFCAAGTKIKIVVEDAAATNAVILHLNIVGIIPKRLRRML